MMNVIHEDGCRSLSVPPLDASDLELELSHHGMLHASHVFD